MIELTTQSFTFVISLAAVVNGLGIVRLLSALAEYVRKRERLEIRHYWVFNLFVAMQLLVHVLLWWSMWGMHAASTFNFLVYLFILCGPTLMYLATSVLMPDTDHDQFDLQKCYFSVSRSYFTLMALTWIWALAIRPVVDGSLAVGSPVFLTLVALALILRHSTSTRLHGWLAVAHWVVLLVYIGSFAFQLGGQFGQ